jgi:hypothetical protein
VAKRTRNKPINTPSGTAETLGVQNETIASQVETIGEGLGLDDVELSEAAHGDAGPAGEPVKPLAELPRGQQGDDSRPICSKHNCLMRAYSSKDLATHYLCPVEGCKATAKRARPTVKVPAEPQYCPQRGCRGQGTGPPVALEVNVRLSNVAQLHMQCPQCGFSLKAPRPQFDVAADKERRRRQLQAEDLAAR